MHFKYIWRVFTRSITESADFGRQKKKNCKNLRLTLRETKQNLFYKTDKLMGQAIQDYIVSVHCCNKVYILTYTDTFDEKNQLSTIGWHQQQQINTLCMKIHHLAR